MVDAAQSDLFKTIDSSDEIKAAQPKIKSANTSKALSAKFLQPEERIRRFKEICIEIGCIPNSLTIYNRFRYSGKWPGLPERKALSEELSLPIERQATAPWTRKTLIEAAVVGCLNNNKMLLSQDKFYETFGSEFRNQVPKKFNNWKSLGEAAKQVEGSIILARGIFTSDGKQVQSDHERVFYDAALKFFEGTGVEMLVTVPISGCKRVADIVFNGWLILEILMCNLDTSRVKKYVDDYLTRWEDKEREYSGLGLRCIHIEPKHIEDSAALNEFLTKLAEIIKAGPTAVDSKIVINSNPRLTGHIPSLDEINIKFKPLVKANGGFYPTVIQIRSVDISVGVIKKHYGGRVGCAKLLNLPLKSITPKRGYYKIKANRVRDFMSLTDDVTNRAPSTIELERHFPGLRYFIDTLDGGIGAFAEELGLNPGYGASGYKNNIKHRQPSAHAEGCLVRP